MADLTDMMTGARGVVNLTSGAPWSGNAYLVEVQKTATFTTFTENGDTGSVSGEYSAGVRFMNAQGITNIELSSGEVRIYLK
jgi:hypothetical protein